MYTLYKYTLIIGLLLLLLSLILDGLSDLFQGLTFFDIHYDALPGILPLNPLQICAFLVGFGGMGLTLYRIFWLHLLAAITMGLLLSYGTHAFLAKLRKVDSETLTPSDIIGCEGQVIVTIFEGGTGSVSLDTKIGKITYSAQSDHYIKQGTKVKILAVKNSLVIVSDSPEYFLTKPSHET